MIHIMRQEALMIVYFSDDNLDKAKEYSANSEYDHLHIFDRIEGVIVEI